MAESSSTQKQTRSVEEIEEAIELYEEDPTDPDLQTNAERRRALLWVLGRDAEAAEIEYLGDGL